MTPETIESGEEWGETKTNVNRGENEKSGIIVGCFKDQKDKAKKGKEEQ